MARQNAANRTRNKPLREHVSLLVAPVAGGVALGLGTAAMALKGWRAVLDRVVLVAIAVVVALGLIYIGQLLVGPASP